MLVSHAQTCQGRVWVNGWIVEDSADQQPGKLLRFAAHELFLGRVLQSHDC